MKYSVWLLLWCAAWSVAQESVQDIRRQIKAVEKETARERELHQKENTAHTAFMESAARKLQGLEQQSVALRAQTDSIRAEIAALEEAREKAQGLKHWVEGRKARYRDALAKVLDSMVMVLQQDIPFQRREAVDAVTETVAQLRKNLITPEEALGRVFELLMDRLQWGFGTETWSGFLNLEQRSIPGKFVRYGGVSALFVSQDGQEVFFLRRQDNEYRWQALGDHVEWKQILKETLKVAEGKAPPALVILPFSGRVGGGV